MTDLEPGIAGIEELSEPMTIGVDAYISPEYARAERDRLWRKVWQQVGRVEELPEVGSYLTHDILDDSIIVVRTAPGTGGESFTAHHNVCMHRGRRLIDVPEGAKQAAILEAEADRQSRILRAQGDRAASYLNAQGQAKAIEKTFAAIRSSKPTPEVLAYQYLQQLPEMAKGQGSKVWVVPSDFGSALQGFARSFAQKDDDGVFRYQSTDEPVAEVDESDIEDWFTLARDPEVAAAVAEAEAVARTPVDDGPAERRVPARDRRKAVDEPPRRPVEQLSPPQHDQQAGDGTQDKTVLHEVPPPVQRPTSQPWNVQSGFTQPPAPQHQAPAEQSSPRQGPPSQPIPSQPVPGQPQPRYPEQAQESSPYQVLPRQGYPPQPPGTPGPGRQDPPRW